MTLPPWYYMTRALGAGMIVYGMLLDHTPERGTLIVTGAGIMLGDKVARADHQSKDDS